MLGVEYGTKFELTGPDGTRIVFNDSSDKDFVGILSPESSGLDSAEVREDAQDRTDEDGGVHGNFYYGRRPVVLQGTVIASSKTDRAEKIAKIKRATNAMRADAQLYWRDAGLGGSKLTWLYLRRQQPVRFSKGWVKDFMIPMVSAYPYIVGEGMSASTKVESPQKSVKKFPTKQTQTSMGAGFGEHNEGLWEPTTFGIEAEDGVYTKIAPLSDPSKQIYLVASAFNFGLPSTATILGVEVGIKRKGSAGGRIQDYEIRLIQNTALIGSNKSAAAVWESSVETAIFGGATDVWGAALTATGLNKTGANEAGIALVPRRGFLWESGNKAEVDAVWMRVYYEEAIAPAKLISVHNNGDVDAPTIIDIYGKTSGVENLRIENNNTEQNIVLTGKINPGQHVQIDTYNRTVRDVDTGANLYHLIDFTTTDWWAIEPGENKLYVTGDYSDGTPEVYVSLNDHYV
jgi:hypothetical protein